jgi:DNA-binding transcriptional MocR family regulator
MGRNREVPHLYEKLAQSLAQAIASGALRPGDRLPSVRGFASQRRVSVATVLQAYLHLENDGLVEVRPKSGHFVRRRHLPAPAEPRLLKGPSAPGKVAVSTGVAALRESMRDAAVVPLGSAVIDPSLLPIRALNARLASIAREMSTAGAAYDAPPGLPGLRRQLARRSVGWGLALHEDEFLTTLGGMEALNLSLRATTRPGDTVAVETPTYFGVLQAIEDLGLRAVEIPSRPREGMDLDALESSLKLSPVKAVVAMPTVSNPLGCTMSDADKERLVKLLARRDLPLIEDDVYGELSFDGTRPRPAKAWDDGGRVLLCGSISKTLAPGYRVGWLSAGRYTEVVRRLKFSSTVANPTLPQLAVAEFLASGGYDRHLRRLRAQLYAQVDRTGEAIAATFPSGTRVSAPSGGFVLWLELPAQVDAYALQARALEKKVAIAPGPIFSARGRYKNCIRLSCGLPWSPRVENALAVVGELATLLAGTARKSA